MKRVLSLVLAVLLILSSFSFVFAEDTEAVKITVIHTNDTHSRLMGTASEIGFAKIATLIKEAREANPNTLVLDAGDALHGMPIVNISKGLNALRVLEKAGYECMAIGNHDFNYGYERLLELKDMTTIDFLSANVLKDGQVLFAPYVIKELAGVKIGIFGLTTPETAYKTSPANVVGITFADSIEISEKIVEELKGQVDVIIGLVHIGLDESSVITSKAIAEAVEGIDILIDGHSHTVLENGLLVNDVLIAQTGNYGQNLGYINIEVKGGEVVSKNAHLLAAADTADIVPDAGIEEVLEEINAENEAEFSKVVASTDVYLDGVRENVRSKETNLGNLSADAARTATGADVAFVNGGGIREDIEIGDITKGKVAAIFPFGNIIQIKKITGEDLLAMLEVSVSGYPAANGAFLQVSGLTFAFDPAKEAGARVSEVMVGDEALDLAAEYSVAVNDFMAIGGDGYDMLKDYPVAAEFGTYEEIFGNYLNTNGTVGSEVSGRIKLLETLVEEPEPAVPAPAEPAPEEVTYIVIPGDVLWKIAAQYNLTYQELAEYNNIANPHLIFPDQAIKVPAK